MTNVITYFIGTILLAVIMYLSNMYFYRQGVKHGIEHVVIDVLKKEKIVTEDEKNEKEI